MPVNTEGFAELVGQIEKMAHRLNTDEEGAPTAKRILQAAAQPIHQQMKANASHDPKIITGKLHGAINIGKVKRRRNGGQNITIGVHRKDWDDPEYVPAYVEYGHRQQPGRYVPAIGKRLKKGWVEGKFMLTISEQEIQKIAESVE